MYKTVSNFRQKLTQPKWQLNLYKLLILVILIDTFFLLLENISLLLDDIPRNIKLCYFVL